MVLLLRVQVSSAFQHQATASQLASALHAEPLFLEAQYSVLFCFYNFILFFAGVAEKGGCVWCYWGTIFPGYGGTGSEGSFPYCRGPEVQETYACPC